MCKVNRSQFSYEKIMYNKRLYVGAKRCPVYDSFYTKMCYKCSNFGHNGDQCNFTPVCKFCAEKHLSKNCENKNKDSFECCNCNFLNQKFGKQKPNKHMAGDTQKCESYKSLFKNFTSKIDNPYNPFNDVKKRR